MKWDRSQRRLSWISSVATAMIVALVVPLGGSATATAASKPSGTPLLIGTIETETNNSEAPNERVTVAIDTLSAWVKSINASGGIDGHPVKLIPLDTGADPGTAQSDIAELQADNVLAIVGPDASATEPTWTSAITKDGLPVIGGVGYTTNYFTNPLFYPGSTTVTSITFGNWASIALTLKKPKAALLICDNSSVCTASVPLDEAAAKDLNIPIVYNQSVNATLTTFTPQCLSMKASGANVLFPAGVPSSTIILQCARQGWKPQIITSVEQVTPDQVKEAPQLSGAIGDAPSFIPDEKFPQEANYFKILKAYDPSLLPGGKAYNADYSISASTDAYVAAEIFEKAIENAHIAAKATATRADLIKGLSEFHGTTLGGISPPLTYSDGKSANPQEPCFYFYKQLTSYPATYKPIPSNKLTYSCEPKSDLAS
jgi:branched-chain amino acid transport system substrate-binding protein